MKLTKRKGFNFYRSYFDIYNELTDKCKLEFIDALLNKQFLNEDPKELKGMSKFAYLSQLHSIEKQVKGYEDATGIRLNDTPNSTPMGTPMSTPASRPHKEEQEKEKEKEKEITKENYQKKEKETPPLKNQKIHDSKQSTLLNNGTMAIHSTGQESLHTTHDPNSPNSFPLNPLSPSRAKLPLDTTNDVPPAKIAVSVDNQQDKETEGESDIDNQEVTFDLDNNSIGKYGFKAYSGTKNGFDPQSGVSISKGKNVAQMAAKKSNGGIFGAVQFRQCLVDNGVDGQVADDYMAVRRAKKGVFTKTAFTLLLNEVQRHNISLNDAALTCIDRNWIAYNHEWVLKLEFQYVNGVKLEKKFNPSPPPISSKPKMIKNENGTFTIRKG